MKFYGENVYSFIDGKFQSVLEARKMLPNLNPSDGKNLGIVQIANEHDVDIAVDAAMCAQKKWQAMGMVKRAEYLWAAARLLEDQKRDLAHLVSVESGKQINEAIADVVEALHMAQYDFSIGHLGMTGKVLADEVPTKECLEILEPRGVVAAITPWNFPIAIPFWLIGLSLIFGNTVILKPSEETPICGQKIAEIFDRAGIPRGVFQVLHGEGDVGWQLVRHPGVDVVLFTGSYEVGSKIKQEVAKYDNKFCTIETGGKSAVVVLKDADLDLAVNAGILSAFKTAGQRCVTGGRVIIERPLYDAYVEKFVEIAKRIKVGDPLSGDTFYGPMINKDAVGKGLRFNKYAVEEGFNILLDRNSEPDPIHGGNWLKPFVYAMEKYRRGNESHVLQEEAFSPHVALIPAESAEEAIAIYNDTRYGLAGSVITNDSRLAKFARDNMKCGIWYWNLPCIGAGVRLAFGGIKKSGNLISSASGIIPAITHPKAVTMNYDTKIVMAQGLSSKI